MWKLSEKAQALHDHEFSALNERQKKLKRPAITHYETDQVLFRDLPFRHPCKREFLISCWQSQWPDSFLIEKDDIENEWLIRMAWAFCNYRAVTLVGAASSGKTHVSSAYAYTKWKADPFATSCFLSTTSAGASDDRAWGTICNLFNTDVYQIGKILHSQRTLTLDDVADDNTRMRDLSNAVKVVLIKNGQEGKNVVGSICGRKNKNVIWACDEAAFMDAGILDARVNLFSNIAGGGFAQYIGIGNAPEEGDPLYIDAEPFGDRFPDGWRSIDKDVDTWWTTRTGICLYFNGNRSPNMKVPRGTKPPFPRIMDWESRDEIMRQAGGEDTPLFWKQFYGFPPSVDISDKLLTQKFLEANGAFEQPLWSGGALKTLAGLDLGFRKDGDPCVLDAGKIGKDARGKTILAHEKEAIQLNPRQGTEVPFEQQIAQLVISELRSRGCHDLALDITGDGGIMLQAIEREARAQTYQLNCLAVSFSGSADDRIIIPGEKRTAREMYDRQVSAIWGLYRLSVQNGVIRGCDRHSKAVSQLCGRKYSTDDKKRFSIEKKEEFKKRLRRSPDHADARCLLNFLALKFGLSGYEPPVQKPAGAIPNAPAPRYAQHSQRSAYAGR